uniref:Protein kinase domain-containing protein n=1 Tax=viral metagenome TaxID=1070528 RepID=A0A6C0FAL1_9ZZZZ|tara:strand:+ start:4932 stop:6650 length:1719 start_codon:yes stop_codon:yes gene_type:complete
MFDIFYKKNNNQDLFDFFTDNSENRITDMQNYIPIYSRFFSLNEVNNNKINLNNKYSINKIKSQETENKFTVLVESDDKNRTKHAKKSFFKYSPLIDATKYMAGKYKDISQNIICNLPKLNNKNVLKKIDCHDNSAYTDSFFSYLTSQLLHTYKFIHGIDFYGSFLGIKENFKFDITDELEYLYDYEFFHENKNILFRTDEIHEELMEDDTRKNRKKIKIEGSEEIKIENIDNEMYDDVFQVLTTQNIKKHNLFFDDITLSNIDYKRENEIEKKSNKTNTECSSRVSDTSNEEDDSDDGDDGDDGDEEEDEEEFSDITNELTNVFANVINFPCQIICLEQLDNTLDFLLEETNIPDRHVISCLFQIIMTLIVYQKLFDFTHNDLHTNNIMFQKTDKKYIHYYYNDKYYSVPTFGKIYKIIDFGRAIYKFKNKQISSDCFYNKGEASGQYNFSVFRNKNKKEIKPNKAFDLTRLGCSLYDHYVEDVDGEIKKPLVKLITEWITDDNEKNILYKKNGEERYPDFKLYKMITRKCTKNTPEFQLTKPMFQKFITSKRKIGKKAPIINIEKIPTYI